MAKQGCTLCGEHFNGFGNNSHITGDRICNNCNAKFELPFRMTNEKRKLLKSMLFITKDGDEMQKNIKKAIKEIDEIRKSKEW